MKRPATPTIDYFDERRGYWAEFEFKNGRMIVQRCHKMGWIAWTMSVLIVALLVWPMLHSPVGIITIIVIAAFMISVGHQQRIADRKRFPIVICDDVENGKAEYQHGQFFLRKHVKKIVVRENKNRQGDDDHVVQIYMKVKDMDKLVLLYQQAVTSDSNEKTENLAAKIRSSLAT